MQIFLSLQRYLSGQIPPSQSCCISPRRNEHYKHSNPIKPRKQSAPSPWIYCTAQTTKGAVKPSHKKEANSLLRAGQAALHIFQVEGENPALLQLLCPAPHPVSTRRIPAEDGNTWLLGRAISTRSKAVESSELCQRTLMFSADKSIGKRSSHNFPKPN